MCLRFPPFPATDRIKRPVGILPVGRERVVQVSESLSRSDRKHETDSPSGRVRISKSVDLPPVGALAHDLRSPLAAVIGFARLAREDLRVGDSTRAMLLLERIERSAGMANALLESALGAPTFARLANLQPVLEQVRAERKSDLERLAIRLVAADDSPAFAVCQVDLYRIVSNLVGNAIDHMGEAEEAAITVSVTCEGAWAVLRVRDNGAGIAPEQRARVFDAAHSRARADAASCHRGFGLAIVRELVGSWGGRAWVEASHDSGTTLCATIPMAR
jgi:signal transduction histidine kinase